MDGIGSKSGSSLAKAADDAAVSVRHFPWCFWDKFILHQTLHFINLFYFMLGDYLVKIVGDHFLLVPFMNFFLVKRKRFLSYNLFK